MKLLYTVFNFTLRNTKQSDIFVIFCGNVLYNFTTAYTPASSAAERQRLPLRSMVLPSPDAVVSIAIEFDRSYVPVQPNDSGRNHCPGQGSSWCWAQKMQHSHALREILSKLLIGLAIPYNVMWATFPSWWEISLPSEMVSKKSILLRGHKPWKKSF